MDQVGEIAFSQSFNDLECRAVVHLAEEESLLLEVRILRDGEVLWTRCGEKEPEDEWAFGCWDDGPGVPCFFSDIDGDGQPEMLAPVPKSDLSPRVYRIFRWDGRQLIFLRKAALMDDGAGEFVWSEPDPEKDTQIKWVDSFENDVAQVVHCRRATTSRRSLSLVPSRRGFVEAS